MDVMGIKKEDLIDGVEIGGAATFLEFASQNAITLIVLTDVLSRRSATMADDDKVS